MRRLVGIFAALLVPELVVLELGLIEWSRRAAPAGAEPALWLLANVLLAFAVGCLVAMWWAYRAGGRWYDRVMAPPGPEKDATPLRRRRWLGAGAPCPRCDEPLIEQAHQPNIYCEGCKWPTI